MSLRDIIEKNRQSKSETERVSTALRAKSGKAAPAGGATPRRTAIAEKMAVAGQRAELGKTQQEKQIADQFTEQRQAEQEQRTELAEKDLEQQEAAFERNATRQTNALINDLTRHGQTMDTQKLMAKTEQLGFLMSLSDEKHIAELQDIAARKRLDSDAAFKLELQQDVFSAYQDIMKDSLAFKSMMNADKREFETAMAKMDMNTALEIMEANIKAANQQAIWSGLGSAAGVAASTDWSKVGGGGEKSMSKSDMQTYDQQAAEADDLSTRYTS